jgi:predicted phosphodiesterase
MGDVARFVGILGFCFATTGASLSTGCSADEGLSRRLEANGPGGSTVGQGGAGSTDPTGTGGSTAVSDDASAGQPDSAGGIGGAPGSGGTAGSGTTIGSGGHTSGGGGTSATGGAGGAAASGGAGGSGAGGSSGDTSGGAGGSGSGGAAGQGGIVRDASLDRTSDQGVTSDTSNAPPDATASDVATPPRISTDPNLKVAFIGDTDTGNQFKSVLDLVKAEGAEALVVQGDMSYSANPDAWWAAAESVLGGSFPIFISRGNHDDSSWSKYLPRAAAHLDGATRIAGAHDANYKTIWRGLVLATIKQGDKGAQIAPFLENEPHIWKICQWHQNQAAMQVGGKTDEMGWDVYETCRKMGAIIETGHEHSYERTKTLVDITKQVVDPTCNGVSDLCVGPGRTFVNVVGLGGQSIRPQLRCLPATPPYGCAGEWAFIYTTNQMAALGAQFITFHAGDPNKASGYFKNVSGQTVDTFAITADP